MHFIYNRIPESCLYEESDDEAKDLASKVCREVVSLGYSCYIASIQQVMAPELTPPSAYTEVCNELVLVFAIIYPHLKNCFAVFIYCGWWFCMFIKAGKYLIDSLPKAFFNSLTYFNERQKVSHHQNIDESLKKQLHDLLRSCRSNTNREDLEDRLRMNLILQCARALGYKKVFLANSSTTTAIRILSQVAIGRGSHLPYQVVWFILYLART